MRRLFITVCFWSLAALPMPVLADLVVVANPQSGIAHLSLDDVVNIYLGRYRRLPSGATAEPIDISDNEMRARFYRGLVRKSLPEINAYWARLVFAGKTRPPLVVESPEAALRRVVAEPGSIAYLERSQAGRQAKIVFELND
ncbi:MAG: hypothetical protein RBS28_08440 [Rhodocyclaceae bacterium]|jgi:hypothetical protein|nr:hypothetical protein [Rhodocyclaceae bacterium]